MTCPSCGAALQEQTRAGVKIDVCTACQGVWLDRGELDKVIEIALGDSGRGLEARNAENARDARQDDERSSFFSELAGVRGGDK